MKAYAESFYKSRQWAKCRETYMKKKRWLCERCGRPAVVVHHKQYITEKNISDPRITLNFDNLEALCSECHNKEHKSGKRARYHFNDKGEIIYD